MSYTYTLNLNTIADENGNACNAYGIDIFQNNRAVASIADISTDRTRMEELIKLINRNNLSIIHIYDIIEDFL